MNRIALEFVPPTVEGGVDRVKENAQKLRELSRSFGMEDRVNSLVIPGMIDEDDDRPVPMQPRMDPLDVWKAAAPELPGLQGLCTQVTSFLDADQLQFRFQNLLEAGIEGVVFVGVPRTMTDGDGDGVSPTDALARFQEQVPHRGVILIPTRADEIERFGFKCEQGATFALTQLLFSDSIVRFLADFADRYPHRPEILLSFGYVPQVETRLKIIQWLIQDPGNPIAEKEQAFVRRLAEWNLKEKKPLLLDLYRRIVDGVRERGFPLGVHFETPYGFSKPAFDLFAEMLDYWAPGD